MLIEDRKIETRYKFEYSKSSFQTRNSISLFVFLRKPLQKQLGTGHLVSAQMARRGVTAQRALSTVTPPQRRMDSLRYATSAVGALFTKGRKRWSVILYVRHAFVNSYPGVCGRRREGQTLVRADGRPRLPPVPAVSLPPRRPPLARRRFTGTPVRSRNTDGRTGDVYTRRRSLIAGRWTAHEDDDAARLFATNIIISSQVAAGPSRLRLHAAGYSAPATRPVQTSERHVNVLLILTLLTVLPVVR